MSSLPRIVVELCTREFIAGDSRRFPIFPHRAARNYGRKIFVAREFELFSTFLEAKKIGYLFDLFAKRNDRKYFLEAKKIGYLFDLFAKRNDRKYPKGKRVDSQKIFQFPLVIKDKRVPVDLEAKRAPLYLSSLSRLRPSPLGVARNSEGVRVS